MIKHITCIECPRGCLLSVEVKNNSVTKVSGNECVKGEKYAVSEIEHPVRIFTSTVLTRGVFLKLLPVRTDKPIPMDALFKAMREIRKIRVTKAVAAGEIIQKKFLGLNVNLIATRTM